MAAKDLLNQRLLDIEDKVFGSNDPEIIGQACRQSPQSIVESVAEIDQKLRAITLGKDKFVKCISELREIESHIESIETYIDPVKSKIEQVLAFSDEIQSDASKIEQIADLESALNSFELPEMTDFMKKVNENQNILLETALEATQMEQETTRLIYQTNEWFNRVLESIRIMHSKLEQLEQQQEDA